MASHDITEKHTLYIPEKATNRSKNGKKTSPNFNLLIKTGNMNNIALVLVISTRIWKNRITLQYLARKDV